MGYRTAWTNSTITSGTINVSIAPAAGEFLIAWAITDANDILSSYSAGWTSLAKLHSSADNADLFVLYKIADGSETTVSFTTNSGNAMIAGCAAFSGIDTTTPLDVAPVSIANSASSTTSDISITPVTNGAVLARVQCCDNGSTDATFTFSTTSGTTGAWTTRVDQHASYYDVALGTAEQTTAGAITNRCTTSVSGGRIGWLFALRPAAGGGASAALGGSAASATAGSAAAARSVAPLGAAVTASAGTLSPQASYSAAITGEQVAASAGTLTPSVGASAALTGEQVSASAGTAVPASAVAVTGSQVSASAGTVAPGASAALSGTQIAASAGTVSVGATAALTGSAPTASAGTAAPQTSVAVTGASSTVAAGTLTASAGSSVSVALTGASATASAGSLAVGLSVAAQGSEATVSAGTVTASSGVAVALSGASVTASAGSLAADLTVAAQGSSVTAAIGTLTLVGGTSVAGSQVPAGRSTGGKRRRVIVRDRVYMVSERDIPALLEAELLDRAPPVTAEVVEGPKPPRKRGKKAPQPVKTVEQVQEAVEQIKARIEPENAWLMQALEAVAYRVLERLQDEEDSIMLLVA